MSEETPLQNAPGGGGGGEDHQSRSGPDSRKTRKPNDDGTTVSWDSMEAEVGVEGIRNFLIEDKLQDPDKYNHPLVRQIPGRDLTVSFLQHKGFDNPLLVVDKNDLDLKMPPAKGFGVADIRAAVGSRRCVDVIDCRTQKNLSMTMKDWHRYFESSPAERDSILNVISLEFSNTKLDSQVCSPRIVRQIDWIDKAWPRHLKELQIEATNSVEDMMYPKVQKYCLMSVEKCYTDFHIDFGGTSVWYHILHGKKVFWLVPPTDENLKKYEDWILSGKQSDVFFGDTVEHCARCEVVAGSTIFIPAGWIHAVYTTQDSIVFGGNFLHSFSVEKQLQVAHIEEVTHVPSKFRFPFFTEMLWYVLDRYIHCLVGNSHLDLPEEEKRRIRLEKGENVDPNQEVLKLGGEGKDGGIVIPKEHVHLTQAELHGIKFIVMYLHSLPTNKKNVPVMLPDPIAVIKDVRSLVLAHKEDCPDQAATNKYILRWSENDDIRRPKKFGGVGGGGGHKTGSTPDGGVAKKRVYNEHGGNKFSQRKFAAGNRRRRVRCKICEACQGGDCQACVYCKDMVKYGGPGRMKQTCEKRRCLHPQLPVCAYCSVCKLDGWFNEPKVQSKESERPEKAPELFECTVCLDIVHPSCVEANVGLGKINEDLSNSWECAKCANSGYSTVPSRNSQVAKKRSSVGAAGGGGDDGGVAEGTKKTKMV